MSKLRGHERSGIIRKKIKLPWRNYISKPAKQYNLRNIENLEQLA